MQIQTIEEKTGLDRATIRYYEQEGLITPQRLQNGYRDYSERHLQDLLKIKLLRQLGLSLETIQQLIEGKDDLQSVLGNQLVVLKAHRAQVDNAEAICKMILQDNVTYETIVPSKYYDVASEKKYIENEVIDTPYTDYVYLESHPVRRFVGRYLDQLFTSAILMLIVVVWMRIRPFGDVQNRLLDIAALFLSMPLNALFLCLLGTTPGKFVVGIFLKTPEGKNMSFRDALQREWAVFRYGMGFSLPIYSWIRLYKSYKIHTEGRELEWDYEHNADVLYTEWDTKRGVFTTILAVICVIAIGCSAVDAQLPKHRNKDLTIAQFAENYNDYAHQNGMRRRLSEKGEWYIPGRQSKVPEQIEIVVSGTDNVECWYFSTNDKQVLEKISFKTSTNTRMYITGELQIAIRTAILSQPNADIIAADEAERAISEMIFVTELGTKKFDFAGVIVNIDIKLLENIYNASVDIYIP